MPAEVAALTIAPFNMKAVLSELAAVRPEVILFASMFRHYNGWEIEVTFQEQT